MPNSGLLKPDDDDDDKTDKMNQGLQRSRFVK